MAASSSTSRISISYRGTTYPLSLPADSTLLDLQHELETLTSVHPPQQKLLYKGKTTVAKDDPQTVTLAQAGLRDGVKVQMLGVTSQELSSLKAAEEQHHKRERVLHERALKKPVKVWSTASNKTVRSTTSYTFQRLEPLAHLPNSASALEVLERLSNDPAILHVMHLHQFSVGLLTELAPHEHPQLLGLNVNAGQAIKLRLRTDVYDGFRAYRDIRRVLCHELAHNVWGNHDDDFKKLNSLLNRQVAEFETSARQGAHRLGGDADVYEPDLEAEAYSDILGQGSHTLGGASVPVSESRDERRNRILQAVTNRLRKEEEELEHSCGTGDNPDVTMD